MDCQLAPFLVDCWYTNEVEEVEKNGVRLGYMGHLISILETLAVNCKHSDELRALVEDTLAGDEVQARWTSLLEEKGKLDTELDHQNRFLADCNPARMHECEPKDFFIEATDTFQDLENTALSENLDNFLSRYISSDLNSNFFNAVNGWSVENLDDFEGLADKNWSKFDGDDEEGDAGSSDEPNFVRPWTDEDDMLNSPERTTDAAHRIEDSAATDSGWANFSSANFADFDTHFDEFASASFAGSKGNLSSAPITMFDTDPGAEGDMKSGEAAAKEGQQNR